MAPDAIQIGDRYYLYIARNVGTQPRADINMIWSKSLDPESPDYKWVEGGVVASSDGIEDCNAIDPGVLLDPNDGRLWLVYGSYFGSNAASVWWVNGKEVISIFNDRQTVIDDGVSKRITLKKGPNIVRCAVINGDGATDFCARFLDAQDQPLKGFTISLGETAN